MFQKNVGTADRVIRMLVGIFLMWYGYDHHSWWGLLGVPIALTGVAGTCFLYKLVGISTCPIKNPTKAEVVAPVTTQK